MTGSKPHPLVHSIKSVLSELLEARNTLGYVSMQQKSVSHLQFVDCKPQSIGLGLQRPEDVQVNLQSNKMAASLQQDSWKKTEKYILNRSYRGEEAGKCFIEPHFIPLSRRRSTDVYEDENLLRLYY